ncbi:Zinc-transporting ATPase [Kiritimatiella glycovorans]|uniref:P-type Zn(2+) transporter n=2 Tax=Kiritimatiella glycovorans TaxID=1307763 RepID=A0A0G3EEF7_9BACT|nr:Zinc-transporting ATPase [Kiritimatiella glycovorans]
MLLLAALIASRLFAHPFHADIVAIAAAVVLGLPLVATAMRDLALSRPNLNVMAALGIGAAFAAGEHLTAAAVAFFVQISNMIEDRSASGARRSIEALIRLRPASARRITPSGEEAVEAAALSVGERIRVRPGELVPGDGIIVAGRSTLNEATITGESLPVEKGEGDSIFAGTVNVTGVLDVEIGRAGQDTTLEQVRSLILEAEATRTPVMRLVDRYAGWYTPLVLILASIVLFFTRDMDRTVAMLVVACPCAILLSGPTAAVAALSAAARLGILIKNIADLEIAGRIKAVVFDKTGTITRGRLHVVGLQPADGVTEDELLRFAAGIEAHSNHPAAQAIVRAAREREIHPADIRNCEEEPGRGVRGVLSGNTVLAGRREFLIDAGVKMASESDEDDRQGSVVLIAKNGNLLGRVVLEDELRPGASEVVGQLRDEGVSHCVMLTGDRRPVAEAVARHLTFTDVVAELLPGQKMDAVKRLRADEGLVAAVGDGINDAPALAEADLSIAMGAAGSEAAIHAARMALLNNELNRIPFLFHLARRLTSVVRQNLVFSSVYVVGMLALSATGIIHPVVAVLLHTASTFIVIVNSARLVREGEDLEDLEVSGH